MELYYFELGVHSCSIVAAFEINQSRMSRWQHMWWKCRFPLWERRWKGDKIHCRWTKMERTRARGDERTPNVHCYGTFKSQHFQSFLSPPFVHIFPVLVPFFHILFQSSAAQVGLLFGSRLPGPVALQHPVATVRCGSRGLLTASCGAGRADVPRKRWNRRWKGRSTFFKIGIVYGFSTKHLKMLKINDDSFLAGPPRLAINVFFISTQDGGCK